MRFFRWFAKAFTDPVSGGMSSTRVSGLACVIAGLVFAFKNPTQSASIGVILGGGSLSFFNRVKSDTPEGK